MVNRYASLATLAAMVCFPLPGRAETCTPLSVVEGQGSEVTKTVTIPSLGLVSKNNWNTDWVVPANERFEKFQATIVSEEDASFRIEMYLKYGDRTTDQFYDTKGVQLKAGEPLTIEATPRPQTEPYQVNLLIGGTSAAGKTYTASVVGCN